MMFLKSARHLAVALSLISLVAVGVVRAQTKYHEGRYAYQNAVAASNNRDPHAAARQPQQQELREAFFAEAAPYRESVYALMMIHDPNLRVGGNNSYAPPATTAQWDKVMRELAALDQLCRTKYPNLTNDPKTPWQHDLDRLPATWCEIAAKRETYRRGSGKVAMQTTFRPMVTMVTNQIQRSLDDPENSTPDDIQLLLFEPAKWKADFLGKLGVSGSDMPADILGEIDAKAAQLKEAIESGAKNRRWKQPPFNRPVEQNMAKTKFLAYYKGATLMNIGSNFGDWKMYKNSLGIPTNRFIRGVALLKIPGRPFCQEQEWIIKQEYSGGGRWAASQVQSFGGGGVFMQCN